MSNLKILVVGPQFPDSFARNISVSLEEMGHIVKNIQLSRSFHIQNRAARLFWRYAPLAFPRIERQAYRELVKLVRSIDFDLLLFTYGIPPEVLEEVTEATNARTACWFPDSIANFNRGYLVADRFDALFLKEPSIVDKLRNHLGLNVFYLPEACNPQWHRDIPLSEKDKLSYACDIAAIGSLHYYRARVLEPLANYDLRIWGNNSPSWLHSPIKGRYTNRLVVERTKAKACKAAKIIVNVVYYAEVDGVNNSMFEIAGCGGFQLASYQSGVQELFRPDEEIVTFASRGELIDKVEYFLSRPEERERIAKRGQLRAHRDHTYEKRLTNLLVKTGVLRPNA